MVRRLIEKYKLQDAVEIYLQSGENGRWVAGTVERHDFPGLWVLTESGYLWFVTNGRRIRPRRTAMPEE